MDEYTIFCLSAHRLMDSWIVSASWLCGKCCYEYSGQSFIWVSVFSSLENKSRSSMAIFCLTFWGTAKLFSMAPAPFYIYITNVWGFQVLQILVNNCWWSFLIKALLKAREFQKNIYFCFIDYAKAFDWIIINCGKFLKRWEYQTTWPASWETCMQVRKQQLELDMEQQTGSK